MKFVYQWIKSNRYEVISFLILLVYFLPFFVDTGAVKYLIHDLLNDKVVYYKNLAESGLLFSGNDAVFEYSMGGFPRGYLLTEFSVFKWLYLFFSAQWAVNINYMLIHVIAFTGMRALLKKYVGVSREIYNLAGLAFAMLPTLPYLGIGVLGIPLLIYAMLNIIKGHGVLSDYLVVFLFPFYSMFAITNMYTFPVLGLMWLYGMFRGYWTLRWRTVLPFILLAVSTLLVEYRLILLSMSGVPNNRMLYYPDETSFLNWKGIAGGTVKAFFLGHYHFHSLSLFVALISVAALTVMMVMRHRASRLLKFSMGLTALLSFLSVFLNNYNLKDIFGENYPFIDYRFWVLLPALWYISFACAVAFIFEKAGRATGIAVLLAGVVFVMFLMYPKDYRGSRYADNVFANTWIYNSHPEQATFQEFYKPALFIDIIRNVPEIKKSRLACLGVIPEVAQFNGLRTIDGYYSLYPASCWYTNRSIDSLERKKSNYIAQHYTNLNNLYIADNESASLPDWNYPLMKQKGVGFLLSGRAVDTGSVLSLRYQGQLYVYSLK